MNIQKAKEQIKNAVKAYLTKDNFGRYKIPIKRQRPIFLMGAPGIGKTAIMAQIAEEMDIGLVSYSMTHHTRQSALGLPFIVKKNYEQKEYSVSEYTMSEIIASVYDMMQATGKKEGILFLDEINCVSETLAPAMLQFLQYKIFGRNQVPQGWVVVTAGNPPEFNKSVRDFDIVTWDRLKRIDVEPDYEAWHNYATQKGEHPAVISYLAIKKEDFYKIETTVEGKSFVTARGWDDLSEMIKLYEENKITVDEELIVQYIQNKRIAKDFAIYYDLYNKYRADYNLSSILSGNADGTIINRAKLARFDERLSLISMLTDSLITDSKQCAIDESVLNMTAEAVKDIRLEMTRPNSLPEDAVLRKIDSIKADMSKQKTASSLSQDAENIYLETISLLNSSLLSDRTQDAILKSIKSAFDSRTKSLKLKVKETKAHMDNSFKFTADTFGEGQELLILLTELTVNKYASSFITKFGCEQYFIFNKSLMFYERGKEINSELENIDIDNL